VCTHVLVLSKGIVLYSGSVHGMSSNEGFFELQAEDCDLLIQILNTSCHRELKKGKGFLYLKALRSRRFK
jgi:ABC-2 type transport system ATP-binding protein